MTSSQPDDEQNERKQQEQGEGDGGDNDRAKIQRIVGGFQCGGGTYLEGAQTGFLLGVAKEIQCDLILSGVQEQSWKNKK